MSAPHDDVTVIDSLVYTYVPSVKRDPLTKDVGIVIHSERSQDMVFLQEIID